MKPYLGMRKLFARWGKQFLLGAALLAAAFILYGWHLASLPQHFSGEENMARVKSSSLKAIADDPVNLPHKLPQLALQSLGHHGPLAMRSISVFFILAAILSFYTLINWWFGRRVAILGTLAFAVSPGVIIAARTATPTSLLICALSAIMASYLWVQAAKRHELIAMLSFFVITALGLYVPGMIWVVIIGAIFFSRRLLKQAKDYHNLLPYILLLFLVLDTPLILAAISKTEVAREILLIPVHFDPVIDILKSIAWTGLGFVWRTRDNLPTTLGFQPVFDLFAIVMAVFGVFHLIKQYSRRRTYVILGGMAAVIIAAGLNSDFLLSSLVISMTYVLVAAGIAYLLEEWFGIFPRNPIARYVALSVITLTLSVHVLYGVRYALVAWPRAPETKAVYVIK